jgi:glycosyltransferase involved in cell wall biosynthesis
MERNPRVSVVIPTRNRPELVLRAVRSALAQTFRDIEVIVVIDGPDPETLAALQAVNDARLQWQALEISVGGSEARNIGVRTASTPWVALLDDDDEWAPQKLALQLDAAAKMQGHVFIGSLFIERSPEGERILPRVAVNVDTPVSELLFARTGLFSGTAYIQTSTWFISRELLLEVPFTKGLRRNQDADWMLHALTRPRVSIAVIPEPLTIFHDDARPERVSQKADWRFHYQWALDNRTCFTRRALAFFLLTTCVHDAVANDEPFGVVGFLFRESFRLGSPNPLALAFFFYYWLVTDGVRRIWRAREVEACA